MTLFWVFLGGGIGAGARYGLTLLLPTANYPWPTLTANLLGCCAIGWLVGHYAQADWFVNQGRALLVTGLLGGFTTFSAFSLETMQLAQAGQIGTALGYVLISVGICLFGAWLGLEIGGSSV